jgi:hypothetical protein
MSLLFNLSGPSRRRRILATPTIGGLFEEGVGFKARVAGPRGRGAGCLPRPPLPTCLNSDLNRYRSLELRQLIRGGPEQIACVRIMYVIP